MLVKLKRKFLGGQRLILGFFIFLFFYFILQSSNLYAKFDYKPPDHRLRNHLITFLVTFNIDELYSDQSSNIHYPNKFFVKSLKVIEESIRKDHLKDDNFPIDNLISSKEDNLANFPLDYLKQVNLSELNIDNWNLIRRNLNRFSTEDLLSLVVKIKNHQQLVLNLDRFELNDFKVVIAVQVHNRIHYLKLLIESLSRVKGIENALLIFSHDLFDLECNGLIEEIKFCKVMQIYYPFSVQIFPTSFPGTSPTDCSRDVSYVLAKLIKCNNAEYPDHYGHYREAKYAQTKHHWFFKINFIFNKLHLTKHYDGLLLLLEEDHYVLPDLLFIMKFLHSENVKRKLVDIISMGSYVKDLKQLAKYSNYAMTRKWDSFKHNMGMSLTRTLFETKIKKCVHKFCTFDDYNWDWSLEHISKKCLPVPLRTTAVIFPRVLHMGECGLHRHMKNCENRKLIDELNTLLETSNILFPKTLKIKTISFEKVFVSKKKEIVNGGWSDVRDHELCLNFTI